VPDVGLVLTDVLEVAIFVVGIGSAIELATAELSNISPILERKRI
jgi:hypothetical protein